MEKIRGIVIDMTRYSDRYNIVTLFTRERGRVAFLSPVGTGKTARMRNALLSLLSEIDAEVRFRPSASLQMLGQVSPASVYTDLYFNPVKRAEAMFIGEFLNRLLRVTTPDTVLYDYIAGALGILDTLEKGVADFHIIFLVSLLPFMGIQPDLSAYSEGCWFDMQAACYVSRRPLHSDCVGGEEAAFLRALSRTGYLSASMLHMNGAIRRRLTSGLVRYYALHYPGVDNLKSLEVLSELFS